MLLCSASGAAMLVRSLPKLRRLAYQNMRRVIALLRLEGVKEYSLDYLRRKLLDCICAILEYNAILEYSVILEFSILYSSIAATSG